MKPRTFRAITAALLLVQVTGCTRASHTARPSVLVLMHGRGVTLNPYSPLLSNRRIGHLVFRGLLGKGADGMPVADLAIDVPTLANGGLSDSGRTVTYSIRRDARWQDGQPLTSEDVAFTVRLLRDGLIEDDPSQDLGVIQTIETPDRWTVTIRLSRADSALAWNLAPFVLPSHLLERSSDPSRDAFWSAPVGSAAYRVTAVSNDGGVQLTPSDPGSTAPDLDVRPVDTEVQAMRRFDAEDCAIWLDARANAVGASESQSTTLGPVWRMLVFNAGSGTEWDDPALRHAVALMTTQTVPDELPAVAYPYGMKPAGRSRPDTSAASSVLDAAGYRLGAGGWRYKAGRQLKLDVGAPPLLPAEGYQIDDIVRVWTSGGLRSSITAGGTPFRRTWCEGGPLFGRDLDGYLLVAPTTDLAGWGWPFAGDDVPSWTRPWGLNLGHFKDETADALYRAARAAPDPVTARAYLARAAARVQTLDGVLFIEPMPIRVISKGVVGVTACAVEENALLQAVSWRVADLPATSTAGGR